MNVFTQTARKRAPEDLVDNLIAISVVAKHLAAKLMEEEETNDVEDERAVSDS